MKDTFKGPREAVIGLSSREGWVRVSTPYDEKLVLDLKNYIEPGSRKWDPDTKYWEVKETCLGILITILKKHFGDNITQNITSNDKDSGKENENPFLVVFEILKKMPNSNIDKIYNALALALHPDRGGNNKLMIELNKAYDQIKK